MILETLVADNLDTINAFIDDMRQYYTGRATPMLLDRVRVKYYDQMVPIDVCGSISVQSHQVLIVRPYESRLTKDIERAIHAANIGLNPQADDEVVKVYLPQKTKEADEKTFALIKGRAEKAKVAVRQNRKRARDEIKSMASDEKNKLGSDIQKQTDKAIEEIERLLKKKKDELKV